MGVFWSDHERLYEENQRLRRELDVMKITYHSLLDKLAPLPYKKDGTLDVYEVVRDEGGTYATEDQERPQREIRGENLRELQHTTVLNGGQIINLARFITIPSDSSMGTVRYVCCDLID